MNAPIIRSDSRSVRKIRCLLAISVAVAAACSSMRAPIGSGNRGVVYGVNEQEAQQVAAMAERAFPTVLEMLVVNEPRPVTIHIVDGLEQHLDGRSEGSRIEIDRRVFRRNSALFVVAHELVHSQWPKDLDELPAAVSEGVADVIAGRIDAVGNERASKQRLASLVEAHKIGKLGRAQLEESLALTDSGLYALTDLDRQSVARALGYLIVWRAGLDRLRILCARARANDLDRVPNEELWCAARIDPDAQGSWIAALVETIPFGTSSREPSSDSDSQSNR